MPEAERRAVRIAAGLCSACGQHPPAAGRCSCADCLARQREAEARRRVELRRARICLDCRTAPADDGYLRCTACRARQCARMVRI